MVFWAIPIPYHVICVRFFAKVSPTSEESFRDTKSYGPLNTQRTNNVRCFSFFLYRTTKWHEICPQKMKNGRLAAIRPIFNIVDAFYTGPKPPFRSS